MFKGLRSFIGGVVRSIGEFISPLQNAVGRIRERITEREAEEIKSDAGDAADVIDELADRVEDHEDAAELEDVAQDIYESENAPTGINAGDSVDDILEEYRIRDWKPPFVDHSAIDDSYMYHMEITYHVTLTDGTEIERTIDRYNYHDDEVINGMIWEHLFATGDDDGGDVSSGDVAGMSYTIVGIW